MSTKHKSTIICEDVDMTTYNGWVVSVESDYVLSGATTLYAWHIYPPWDGEKSLSYGGLAPLGRYDMGKRARDSRRIFELYAAGIMQMHKYADAYEDYKTLEMPDSKFKAWYDLMLKSKNP